MEFTRLSAPSLKDLFVQQLQGKILSGELPVGTQLPPERELARQMQVSRAVVNGGLAPSPSLVEGTTQNGTDLDTVQETPQPTQVMSQETAEILKADLLACVMEQPGQNATAPNGEYVAGGKTGTAQTGQMDEKGEEYNNGWFAGFFNAGGTDYVVVVMAPVQLWEKSGEIPCSNAAAAVTILKTLPTA